MQTLLEPLDEPLDVSCDDPRLSASPIPLLYEDEEEDVGDHDRQTTTVDIFSLGAEQHFATRPELRIFKNLNTYFDPPPEVPHVRPPCIASDVMVLMPDRPLEEHPSSYFIGRDGPTPLAAVEVLSERTARRDLAEKRVVYAYLRVREYLLIDVSGEFLPERLRLLRLQADGTWVTCNDADGGITSELGFRLLIDADGKLRMTDLAGRRYLRPREVHEEVLERKRAEDETRQAVAQARQAAEQARQAAERARQAEKRERGEVAARLQAEEQARQAEERERHAVEARLRAEDQARQAAERSRLAAERERQETELRKKLEAELEQLRVNAPGNVGKAPE